MNNEMFNSLVMPQFLKSVFMNLHFAITLLLGFMCAIILSVLRVHNLYKYKLE